MTDTPWQGDACSLVDAFRAGERSPVEELEASLASIKGSKLNNWAFLDPERARQAAKDADVSMPFGGVPAGIKELEQVEGWPDTGGSVVFKDRIADHTCHHIQRLLTRGGVVPVGLTTSSEFGGLNVSVTKLNGVAHNQWQEGRDYARQQEKLMRCGPSPTRTRRTRKTDPGRALARSRGSIKAGLATGLFHG